MCFKSAFLINGMGEILQIKSYSRIYVLKLLAPKEMIKNSKLMLMLMLFRAFI